MKAETYIFVMYYHFWAKPFVLVPLIQMEVEKFRFEGIKIVLQSNFEGIWTSPKKVFGPETFLGVFPML